jgi:hypothetical protein
MLPKTTIFWLLYDPGLRFLTPRNMPCRLSEQQQADKIKFSQEILGVITSLGQRQEDYVMTRHDSWM